MEAFKCSRLTSNNELAGWAVLAILMQWVIRSNTLKQQLASGSGALEVAQNVSWLEGQGRGEGVLVEPC